MRRKTIIRKTTACCLLGWLAVLTGCGQHGCSMPPVPPVPVGSSGGMIGGGLSGGLGTDSLGYHSHDLSPLPITLSSDLPDLQPVPAQACEPEPAAARAAY